MPDEMNDGAAALLRNRFFPRQEGGPNVRQVWVEVQLRRALSLASAGHCDRAMLMAAELGYEVPGVSFTNNGLEPFVNSGRTNDLLGKLNASCGKNEDARTHFTAAGAKSGAGEMVWACMAAKELPGFEANQWTARLQSALEHVSGISCSSDSFADADVYLLRCPDERYLMTVIYCPYELGDIYKLVHQEQIEADEVPATGDAWRQV